MFFPYFSWVSFFSSFDIAKDVEKEKERFVYPIANSVLSYCKVLFLGLIDIVLNVSIYLQFFLDSNQFYL